MPRFIPTLARNALMHAFGYVSDRLTARANENIFFDCSKIIAPNAQPSPRSSPCCNPGWSNLKTYDPAVSARAPQRLARLVPPE